MKKYQFNDYPEGAGRGIIVIFCAIQFWALYVHAHACLCVCVCVYPQPRSMVEMNEKHSEMKNY